MEEHKRCMLDKAPCGYPPTLLEQMGRPKMEREEQKVIYSPSSIGGCHRKHSLQKDHDWYVNPDSVYSTVRGNLLHAGMEKEGAPEGTLGVVRELRMHAPITTKYGEQRFSGQVDEILLRRIEGGVLYVALTDWKSKSLIAHSMGEADRRHVYQINHYKWLATQVLGDYLNNWETMAPADAKIYLNAPLSPISRVVVEEASIVYMSMAKQRTFTSDRFLYVKGKLKGEKDSGGHWHAYKPHEYEEVELSPIILFNQGYTEGVIRAGIEEQIEGENALAAPLVDEDAKLMCPTCAVREICVTIGEAQGFDMYQQRVR